MQECVYSTPKRTKRKVMHRPSLPLLPENTMEKDPDTKRVHCTHVHTRNAQETIKSSQKISKRHTHTRTENGKLLLIDFAFRPTATSGTGSVNCTMRPAIWHEARIVFSSFQGTVFFLVAGLTIIDALWLWDVGILGHIRDCEAKRNAPVPR